MGAARAGTGPGSGGGGPHPWTAGRASVPARAGVTGAGGSVLRAYAQLAVACRVGAGGDARDSQLQPRASARGVSGVTSRREAEELLEHHLAAKAQETDRHGQPITVQWLAAVKQHLDRAVVFFGTERLLGSIARADLLKWITGLGRQFQGGAARQHLNSLSNLYRRAMADGFVTVNPVSTLLPTEKPKGAADEADWLEVPEAALLIEAAKHYEPKRDDLGMPFAYPLIATMLLTGGRLAEVLGLEVDDVSLERKTVTFRPNKWRRLKTKRSHRAVPLWPNLSRFSGPTSRNGSG